MPGRFSLCNVGLLGACLFVVPSAAHAVEVWSGSRSTFSIARFDLNGMPLGTFGTLSRNALAIVNGEVWAGGSMDDVVERFDFATTPIGTFTGAFRNEALLQVGNEVWSGSRSTTGITRFTLAGALIGTFGSLSRNELAMVNGEVWAGGSTDDLIERYASNATFLGSFNAAARNEAIQQVGSEAWTASRSTTGMARFSLAGGSLGTFGALSRNTLAAVGAEIWAGGSMDNVVERYSAAGSLLGTFTGADRNEALLLVGEVADCNSNGVLDFSDIAGITSNDCNSDDIPDECEIDVASAAPGGPFYCTSSCDLDCNSNGIPDACDPDCDASGTPDDCDLAGLTAADCNTNFIPDECDLADLTSPDCNANQTPDECDTLFGTSDDCNRNGTPDDCEPASGDFTWTGPNGGSFASALNWNPATVPGTAGNAILQNTTGIDNRTILDASGATTVCFVQISSTDTGRQILQVDAGSMLFTNDGITVSPGGDIDLRGGTLAGGTVSNTSNSVAGHGLISADIDNQGILEGRPAADDILRLTGQSLSNGATGVFRARIGILILVGTTSVSQSGELEARANASLVFDDPLLNGTGGQITLLGGVLGAAGLINSVDAEVYGFGTIDASVLNDGRMNIVADTQIVGDLENEGTVTIQSGILTVTGGLSGSGTIIGGFGGRGGESSGLTVHGNFDLATQDWRQIDLTNAVVQMAGDVAEVPQTFEVTAPDRGDRSLTLPDASLFSIGTLQIGPTPTTVRLVDRHRNNSAARQAGPEAVYVKHLVLDPAVTLDLGGLRLYYETLSPTDPFRADSGVSVMDSVGGGGLISLHAKRNP